MDSWTRARQRRERRRRIIGSIVAIIAALALIITAIAPAFAAGGQGFTEFHLDATAHRDGTIDAEIDLEFDFAGEESHGVYLTYITRQRIEDDPEHYRLLEFSDIDASSPTAPADVRVERDSDGIGIYVGDPDVEVTGTHRYTISFTLDGVVNAGAGEEGQDEIYWNVIGSGFEQPLYDVQITLSAPAQAQDVACWVGEVGSTDTCTEAELDPVTYTQTLLAAGEGMTIAAEYPEGVFPGVEPILGERETFASTMGGPVIIALSVLASILAVVLLPIAVSRVRRDERFAGLTPGTFPPQGAPERTERAPREIDPAVQFTPPEGLRPGDVGLITHGAPKAQFLAATLVDLAVRGHVHITTDPGEPGRAGWRLTRRHNDTAGTNDTEALLLNAVFDGDTDTEVTLKKLPRSRKRRIAGIVQREGNRMKTEGWFTSKHGTAVGGVMAVGAIVLGGGILTTIFGAFRGFGLLGAPLIVAGVTLMLLGRRATKRTPTGYAYYVQSLGFKKYLETAEAGQLRFEAGEDIFSRYLPYAMVFGVVKRWVGLFEELTARGQWNTSPAWYTGAGGGFLFANSGEMNSFTSNIAGLQSAVSMASMTGSTSGSSGGSGFSGGFSGGGVGGGGGGSW